MHSISVDLSASIANRVDRCRPDAPQVAGGFSRPWAMAQCTVGRSLLDLAGPCTCEMCFLKTPSAGVNCPAKMTKKHKGQDRIPAPRSSATPSQGDDGDAEILLDDKTTVPVHSQLLALKSSVLRDVVLLAGDEGRGRKQIPLKSTPRAEASALVVLLYSSTPESYVLGLPLESLRQLRNICHRFAFEDFLTMLDQALARHTGAACPQGLDVQAKPEVYLSPANAAELYWSARSQGLDNFSLACANYIGAHVKEVAEAASEDALGPVLVQAAKHMHAMNIKPLYGICNDLQQGLNQVDQIEGCYCGNGGYVRDLCVHFSRALNNLKAVMP